MENLADLVVRLRACAEPTRLRLLAICARGEFTVSDITGVVGQSQPRVSRHLKLLCDAGLLERFREHHFVFYRVPPTGDGATIARQLLDQLPPDDEQIRLDRQRLDRLREKRALAAREYLRTHGEQVVADLDQAQVDDAIRSAVADHPIGDMLDIGTGTGRILRLLAIRARQAVGIDTSQGMRLVARSNLQEAGLSHCTVRHGDMYRLKFANATFDTVTIDQVLELAEAPERVLGEAARVLRPGGRIVIVALLSATPDSPFSGGTLRAWLNAAGFVADTQQRVESAAHRMAIVTATRAATADDVAA